MTPDMTSQLYVCFKAAHMKSNSYLTGGDEIVTSIKMRILLFRLSCHLRHPIASEPALITAWRCNWMFTQSFTASLKLI